MMQFNRIGRWWSKESEIDIVALDDYSNIVWFGESKWSNKKIGINVYNDLQQKSCAISYYKNKQNNRYILFSKSGFTDDLIKIAKKDNVVLIDCNTILEKIK